MTKGALRLLLPGDHDVFNCVPNERTNDRSVCVPTAPTLPYLLTDAIRRDGHEPIIYDKRVGFEREKDLL